MDFSKDIDLSGDNEILSAILDDHDITVKQLVMWSGRQQTIVYKYLSGQATIPSIIWRELYRHTGDDRIPEIFVGEMPYVLVPVVNSDGDKLDADKLESLIAMRQSQIGFESQALDILTSDKDDREKRQALADLRRKFPDMIKHQSQLFQAITGSCEF